METGPLTTKGKVPMADIAVPVVSVLVNVASAAQSTLGTAVATTETAVIECDEPRRLLVRLTVGATGGTVKFLAGDAPPAKRTAYGDLTVTLAANATKHVLVESGRFTHYELPDEETGANPASLRALVTGDTVTVTPFLLDGAA